jgi:2-hydroxy-3-keto-5-methylthiopentenyl-1-phosphate phosphatase
MNAQQRKEIEAIKSRIEGFIDSDEMIAVSEAHQAYVDALATLRAARQEAVATLDAIYGDIDDQQNVEQDKFDNMPESLQGGDKGQAMEAAIESLSYAASSIEDVKSALESDDIDENEEHAGVSGDLETAAEYLDAAID